MTFIRMRLIIFPCNRFTGNQACISRNHRIGEAMAVCMMAGVNIFPYMLPKLQRDSRQEIVSKHPSFYMSRCFKNIMESEYNKTKFTRVVGLMFYPGGSYAVYNARDSVMKWSGAGELKARLDLTDIVRMNAGLKRVESALLMGTDAHIAMKTLLESDTSRKKTVRMDSIYQYIHFVPLDRNGIDLIKILTLPDRNERLLRVLFKPEQRIKGYGSFEYDAKQDQTIFYSHLDNDIARLIRFREALQDRPWQMRESPVDFNFVVICFPWQVEFLQGFLGDSVRLRTVEMGKVLKALGIG
jgi:hypothetical protein